MSAPLTTAIVHRAAPPVAGADDQWCADCGAVVLRSLAACPPWPIGALIGIRERRAYVLSLTSHLLTRPFADDEQRCRP